MNQQTVPEKRKSRAISVGVVTLCYIFGGVLMLAGGGQFVEILWHNVNYGPIAPHTEYARNRLALTPLNLLSCALSLGTGAMLWVVAGSIWNRKRRLAIVAFVVVIAGYIGVAVLSP